MMNAGIYDEAAAWRDWLQRAVAGSPGETQIMYGLRGERRLTEWEVDWLPGYAEFQAGAGRQRRAPAVPARRLRRGDGRLRAVAQRRAGRRPRKAGSCSARWSSTSPRSGSEPDNGIWETRGPQQHFVYSKVMAWVCFDRAIKAAEQHGLEGPVEKWREMRDAIHAEVCDKGFDEQRNTFRAAYDSDLLDASLLLLAQTGFVKPDDPRFVGTVEAIENELLVDGFVMRYSTHEMDDGLQPGEGAFLACSFWLADAYVSIGRKADAEKLFKRLLADPQRPRPARRGVRPARKAPAGQLPAGLQPCRADQHRLQPDAGRQAAGAARRRPRARGEPGRAENVQPVPDAKRKPTPQSR